MNKHPYIVKRPGSQNYYYHRQIPSHLQPVLKRAQYWKSLRTPVLQDALRNAAVVALDFLGQMETAELLLQDVGKARRAAGANHTAGANPALPQHELTAGHIPALCNRYATAILRTDDEEREGMEPEEVLERRKWLSEAHEVLSLYAAGRRAEVMAETAHTLLAAEGMRATAESGVLRELLAALQVTDLQVLAEQLARLHGGGTPTSPKDPLPPKDCDNWDVILKTWSTKNGVSPKTYDSTVADARRFDELVGHVPIWKLERKHVETFRDALRTVRGPGTKALSAKRVNDC